MEFEKLLETQVSDKELSKEVNSLLERKRAGEEFDIEPRIGIINNFLEDQIQYYRNYVKHMKDIEYADIEVLNNLFRETLKEVWE